VGNNFVAQALAESGQDVRRWTDIRAQGWSDVKWIHAVGPRGWISLTRDDNIRRRVVEIEAVRDARAMLFFIQGNKTGKEQAGIVVAHLARIIRIADGYAPPFIAHVTSTGVEVVPHRLLPEPCRRSAVKRD
jgi:PIN like domain